MKGGFIAVYRSVWDHTVFKKSPMSECEAFIWMVSKAAFSNTSHRVGSLMVEVPRGSFLITLRELQHNMLWSSTKRAIGFLKLVEKEGMISTKVVGKGGAKKTQVTICNYSLFQGTGHRPETETGTERKHTGNSGDTVKNKGNKGNKGILDEKPKSDFSPLFGVDQEKPEPKPPKPKAVKRAVAIPRSQAKLFTTGYSK